VALKAARQEGLPIEAGARGFVYNGDLGTIVSFFDIGTRPQQSVMGR
jgi:hypothetical protein